MSILQIPTARVFVPLVPARRYKAAFGGRGSGKSHFFASLLVERAFAEPGLRVVCIREVQKDLEESAKRLIEDKIKALGMSGDFDCQRSQINTPGGGTIIFEGMQDHNAESIKSLEGFDVAWVEEAQTLSQSSLTMLRPTIRKDGSELWFSWNPRRKSDPVDLFFRGGGAPSRSAVVRANWNDNPWFPAELQHERVDDFANNAEEYHHIWEGDYVSVAKGAYFAKQLASARAAGRIGRVELDPLMDIWSFWDLGVADHTAIWIAQFVGTQIRVLDYCEGQGQSLAFYVNWLRSKGYRNALCVLPHDGAKRDGFSAVKFEDHLRQAGFEVRTVANQGKGAAMQRIEAARRLFPSIYFNEATTQAGRDALGWYHEKRDERRVIGLGPEHDWSSHGADAFGLMCVVHRFPRTISDYDEDDDEVRDRGRSAVTGY